MKTRILSTFAVAFAVAIGSGCTSHPATMAKVKTAVALPAPPIYADGAEPFGTIGRNDKDALLMHQERGRARQISGDAKGSAEDYLAAAGIYGEIDERPVVAVSDSAKAGAFVLNDLVLPYEGNAHERTLVRTLDAFNRIEMLDWDAFGVDMRNMVYDAEKEIRNNENRIEAARAAAKKDGRFVPDALLAEFLDPSAKGKSRTGSGGLRRAKGVDPVTETLVEAHQNGYSWYLAGFWSEMEGRWSDAALCYGRVCELAPDAVQPRADAARAGETRDSGAIRQDGSSDIAVFFEEGWAPVLNEAGVRFVLGKVSAAFVFPYYPKTEALDVPAGLQIVENGDRMLARAECVADFRRNAFRAWNDRIPAIMTRAAIRSTAKAVVTATMNTQAARRGGSAAKLLTWLAGVLFTQATEAPDLRSWNLAPRFGHVARFRLPAGLHTLSFVSGLQSQTLELDVPEDGAVLVHVVSVPGKLSAEATGIAFDGE